MSVAEVVAESNEVGTACLPDYSGPDTRLTTGVGLNASPKDNYKVYSS